MPNEKLDNQLPASDIELRSEQVQDILTKVPQWMIRWGNLVILIILGLVMLFSYFIKYPDINTTQITVTTAIPPEKLITRTSGRIESILVADNQVVQKNTPLAVIENAANYEDVFLLKSIVDIEALKPTKTKKAQSPAIQHNINNYRTFFLTNVNGKSKLKNCAKYDKS